MATTVSYLNDYIAFGSLEIVLGGNTVGDNGNWKFEVEPLSMKLIKYKRKADAWVVVDEDTY